VLFLDEPTNHLDLEMRQALTMALQSFEGAMVLVSHDRHLLRNTVDTFWRVADGTVTEFDGDLDEYERWLSDPRRKETAAPAQEVPGNSGQAQQGRQNRKKQGPNAARNWPLPQGGEAP